MLTLRPNSFDLLYNNFFDDFDCMGKSSANKTSYSLVKEKDNVVFQTLATGLNESDISMSIENKKLYVKGNPEKKGQFVSSFDFKLPVGDVQAKNTNAELSQGILTIRMPVKEDKKSVSINF